MRNKGFADMFDSHVAEKENVNNCRIYIYMQEEDYEKIEEYVTSIPDFPEPGIIFRDITSVIGDPDGLKLAIDS